MNNKTLQSLLQEMQERENNSKILLNQVNDLEKLNSIRKEVNPNFDPSVTHRPKFDKFSDRDYSGYDRSIRDLHYTLSDEELKKAESAANLLDILTSMTNTRSPSPKKLSEY